MGEKRDKEQCTVATSGFEEENCRLCNAGTENLEHPWFYVEMRRLTKEGRISQEGRVGVEQDEGERKERLDRGAKSKSKGGPMLVYERVRDEH